MLAAILFTDFAGFSTLETALPAFWDGVMRRVADVLEAHDGDVTCRNSWGDALYAVTVSAPVAAGIALELQDALAAFDYATLGLDGAGGMRIGVHYGPAWRTTDHITGRTTFYGTEVSKAARIEPVTRPRNVQTEPFAAILASRPATILPLCRPHHLPETWRLSDVPADPGLTLVPRPPVNGAFLPRSLVSRTMSNRMFIQIAALILLAGGVFWGISRLLTGSASAT